MKPSYFFRTFTLVFAFNAHVISAAPSPSPEQGELIPFSDRSQNQADLLHTEPSPHLRVREIPFDDSPARTDRAIDTILRWANLPRATKGWNAEQKRKLVDAASTLSLKKLRQTYPKLDAENLATLHELASEASSP